MGTVYKYCDKYGLNILRDRELKVTPPNEFNDAFEFRPQIKRSSLDVAFRATRDESLLREIYTHELREGGFSGTLEQYRSILQDTPEAFRKFYDETAPDLDASTHEIFPEIMGKTLGVLCLSACVDSIPMWGYYADKHRGIVIGFDKSWAVFMGRTGLRTVTYVKQRAIWDAAADPHSPERNQAREQMVFSKSSHWKHERELRQLFKLDTLRKRPLEDGSIGYFLPLPSWVITRVIMGKKCAYKEEVTCLLSEPHFSHVRLEQADLHQSRYSMKFEVVSR